MKTLLFSVVSVLAVLITSAAPVTGKEIPDYTFYRPGNNGNHLHIAKYCDSPNKETFLLSIEPGCIILEVSQQNLTDDVCTLKIIGSPAGQVMIDMAKATLGIQSETFDINYVVQEQKAEGLTVPPYNKILEVTDHKHGQ